MKYDFLIVGAGFAGAVMAERIASQLNKKVLIVEKRNHIAGNAYDECDEYGILIHKYGPHIFHTNSKKIFDYLSHFTEWRFYEHKILAFHNNVYYPIPINRLTINKLYNLNLKSEDEVEKFFESKKEKRFPILTSEDIMVNQVGYELFEKFFKHYTKKQWKLEPKELSSQVCGRVPVRTNEDCRYFTDEYQFMPKDGYTKMFEKLLKHKNIEIVLETDYKSIIDMNNFNKIIFTGPIDEFFDYKFGKLPYRSIDFIFENHKVEKYLPTAVVNYSDNDVNYTRATEYKYLTGQISDSTTISKEFTKLDGEPFYPVPTEQNRELYLVYKKEAEKLKAIIFCGRLAQYQYFNMDQAVANSLKIFESWSNNKLELRSR